MKTWQFKDLIYILNNHVLTCVMTTYSLIRLCFKLSEEKIKSKEK